MCSRSNSIMASLLRSQVIMLIISCAAFIFPSIAGAANPAEAVFTLVEKMESSYASVNDYQAVFNKQERVNTKLLPEETILLKFQKPLKVYMKWIGEPLKGTEALYVQGKNDNKLIGHRGGVLGVVTLSLDPRSSITMKNNHHPITEVGFGFIIKEFRRNLVVALRHGEIQIDRMEDEDFKGRPSTVVEARFTPREGRKYYASRMVIHIDKEFLLPVGNALFDEKDVLFEKYTYTDVKLNVGLTEMDFSPYNKNYRF